MRGGARTAVEHLLLEDLLHHSYTRVNLVYWLMQMYLESLPAAYGGLCWKIVLESMIGS